jgi:hypothetical protein
MVQRSIVNVLGCLTIIALTSACSSLPKEIFVSAEPIDKPKLILPKTDELDLQDVEWVILVKENWEEQWAKLEQSGEALAFFATTDSGYENLGLNYSDLRAFIQQQDAIIAAYRSYYLEAEEEFNEANGLDKEE